MELVQLSIELSNRNRTLKENYIDKGKMGVSTGQGFYKYPNPSFAQLNFLK